MSQKEQGASFKKKDYKSDFIWANKYKSSLEVFCFKNQILIWHGIKEKFFWFYPSDDTFLSQKYLREYAIIFNDLVG